MILDNELWEAFKGMCETYKKKWTYYVETSKKDQSERQKRKETFSIGCLKPLQATSSTDFIFLCQKTTMSYIEEIQ